MGAAIGGMQGYGGLVPRFRDRSGQNPPVLRSKHLNRRGGSDSGPGDADGMPGLTSIGRPLILSGKRSDISGFDYDPSIVGIEADQHPESSTWDAWTQRLPGLSAIGRTGNMLIDDRPANVRRNHVQLGQQIMSLGCGGIGAHGYTRHPLPAAGDS